MKYLFNFFFLLGFSALMAQPFPVGHRQLTLTDPARPGRNIGLEIYYPGTSAGDDVPVASGSFPVLVFGHGFLMVWSSYQPYWETLVPEGYILAFPTTEGSFSPSHSAFGQDLSRIRSWIATENTVTGSVWENHIAPTCAVMGHSMGGGASFLALAGDTAFTTLIGIAAAETNPSAMQAATSILKPVLILAGGNDCVTPIPQHQQPMYDTLTTASKCLITLTGGSHCQFAATDFFCNTGESTCQPAPAITPATQQSITFQAVLPWLNFYLKGDCPSGPVFQQSLNNAGITYLQTGLLDCNLTSFNALEYEEWITLYPNPSTGSLTLNWQGKELQEVAVHESTGRQIGKWEVMGQEALSVDLSYLQSGLYLVRFKDASGKCIFRKWQLLR